MNTGGEAVTKSDAVSPVAAVVGGDVHQADRAESLGETLESFREYLTRVANRGLGHDLTAKFGASDLVQETFLAAQRDFGGFRGRNPTELRAWLETILRHRLANARREFRDTDKRRVDHEVPLQADPDEFGTVAEPGARGGFLAAADTISTPSVRAMKREREVALLGALAGLPERYRVVVRWHHEERLTFEQIAGRLGTTTEAARKLWARSLIKLREAMGSSHDLR